MFICGSLQLLSTFESNFFFPIFLFGCFLERKMFGCDWNFEDDEGRVWMKEGECITSIERELVYTGWVGYIGSFIRDQSRGQKY